MITNVWVLLELTRDERGDGVRVCGTTTSLAEAHRWGLSRRNDIRSAVRVPLDGLADGEAW